MKKAAIAIAVLLACSQPFAQGLINFINSPTTLFSDGSIFYFAGDRYFGLLTAPMGTQDPREFSFSGLYATNSFAAGRFVGGNQIIVPGWTPGESRSFLVAGWSASLGHDWNQNWLNALFPGPGLFGLSSIGSGAPGGFDGTGPAPPLNLFGGATGIQTGFALRPVPEPSPRALLWSGAIVLALSRRGYLGRKAW
jgi:hypothetical protein